MVFVALIADEIITINQLSFLKLSRAWLVFIILLICIMFFLYEISEFDVYVPICLIIILIKLRQKI